MGLLVGVDLLVEVDLVSKDHLWAALLRAVHQVPNYTLAM